MLDRPLQLIERLGTYPWWQVLLTFTIIWLVVFVIVRFVQGTRAAGALKGMLFVLVTATLLVRILGQHQAFQHLTFLYERFLALLAITLVVVFQPELRRGLIRLGETPLFRKSVSGVTHVSDVIAEACAYLSKLKYGGLIVIEREVGLRGLVEGGTQLNAELSSRLLQTIFFPGSALHDLAVVVHGDRILSAGVQLPLAEPEEMPDAALGSRHRAAVGLSKESDALIVVVSEETGAISIAERGRLDRGFTADELRDEMVRRLSRGGPGDVIISQGGQLGQGLGRLGRRVAAGKKDNEGDGKKSRGSGKGKGVGVALMIIGSAATVTGVLSSSPFSENTAPAPLTTVGGGAHGE